MSSCPCCAVEQQFDDRIARNDLRRFLRRGPDRATRDLLSAVERLATPGASLLDVGGGVGVLHHELLERGFASAVHVDVSPAYLTVAAQEAARRDHGSRVVFHRGDLRALAGDLPLADVVTLDRVVCCDPDCASLLATAAGRARRAVAFTYPRDRWYIRAVVTLSNWWRRVWGNAFRVHVHSPEAMGDALVRAGLRRTLAAGTLVWAVELFERAGSDPQHPVR